MKDSLDLRTKKHILSVAICGLTVGLLYGCTGSDTGATGGSSGSSQAGGQPGTAGASSAGGTHAAGGTVASGGATSNVDGPRSDQYIVAMLQSSKTQAVDLSTDDVAALVSGAVSQAGGLDFIKAAMTVVLKPNLVTLYEDAGMLTASPTVNGIATDWRVVKAVADLVRAKNPTGKILVMEGSVLPTAMVYSVLGYTSENFGSSVDEFISLEGTSCTDPSTSALEQRAARSGKTYWVNSRYVSADVVISIPTMKTDADAGITGAVENLGIGATPAGQYSSGINSIDCTRTKIDHSSPETRGEFIRDYYGIRPADFVVMDGLQGLEHGQLPVWDDSGTYDYASSTKNMRLILAGRNAVAVDTIEALVMKCDPTKVSYLTLLEFEGLGATDTARITVVGKQVSDVAKPFAGKQTNICPGK